MKIYFYQCDEDERLIMKVGQVSLNMCSVTLNLNNDYGHLNDNRCISVLFSNEIALKHVHVYLKLSIFFYFTLQSKIDLTM